jgi:DNA/RNA-binding domain of Phe-tRNA-synthetase-like protein
MFTVSDEWKRTYPGACAGVLAMSGVTNPKSNPALEQKKRELEQELRRLFKDPADLKSNQAIQAYRDYYKRFKKSYHVHHQLESVIFKGKSLPSVASLVEAMFIAELRNMLLTAGHDRDALRPPLRLDVATGNETYVRLNGEEQLLKAGDMMIRDSEGVISSVIYGPDKRTRISPETTRVLFTTYVAPGIGEQSVHEHLKTLETTVKMIAPEAKVDLAQVYAA